MSFFVCIKKFPFSVVELLCGIWYDEVNEFMPLILLLPLVLSIMLNLYTVYNFQALRQILKLLMGWQMILSWFYLFDKAIMLGLRYFYAMYSAGQMSDALDYDILVD
jgi:hypothetical protein